MQAISAGSNTNASPINKPIRVLLVDDHKSMLWGLQRLIETASPQMETVGVASSEAEVFSALKNCQPDVILLDLDLNGKNSLDFLEVLLQQSAARVLVFTGCQNNVLHQQCILKGASGVLLKSEQAEIILKAITFVHAGEIWFDRAATGLLLKSLSKPLPLTKQVINQRKIAMLTPKERQVVATMAFTPGARNKVIANYLHMSEHTLRNHLTGIYAKLEVENRLALYMFAIENNLNDYEHAVAKV